MNRRNLTWTALALVCAVPLVLAGLSPQLEWRGPVYIAAGFAGIIAMLLMLIQPLLAAGQLPLSNPRTTRRMHRLLGAAVLGLILLHVGALWITSPPDVVDALLLRSPTQFSLWGVIAMWAIFATGALALWRVRLGPRRWRLIHKGLAVVIIGGTIAHALLIEGTMEWMSKVAICVLLGLAGLLAVTRRVPWR